MQNNQLLTKSLIVLEDISSDWKNCEISGFTCTLLGIMWQFVSPTSSEKAFAVNLMQQVLTVISKLNSMFLVLGTSCTILW